MRQIIFISFLIFFSSCSSLDTKKTNKALVSEFYTMAFVEHKPVEAAEKYIGDQYIQHNPYVADGKQAFIDFFKEYFKDPAHHSLVNIKNIYVDGDIVVLHVHSRKSENEVGSAGIDIFRVDDGKIVEHWDVWQKIPEKMPHTNGMI